MVRLEMVVRYEFCNYPSGFCDSVKEQSIKQQALCLKIYMKMGCLSKVVNCWCKFATQYHICSVVTSGWACMRSHNIGMWPQICCQAKVSPDALLLSWTSFGHTLPHGVALGPTWSHLASFGHTGTHFINWSQMMGLIGCDHAHFSVWGSGGLAWS